MEFADELLEQAHHLAHRERKHPRQASLRRAVSTAYYGLFHLIVNDGARKWSIVRQQSLLARTVDHRRIRSVCGDTLRTVVTLSPKRPHPIHPSRNQKRGTLHGPLSSPATHSIYRFEETEVPMMSPETTISTRRFCCRPSLVSFEATGRVFPNPLDVMLSARKPCATR